MKKLQQKLGSLGFCGVIAPLATFYRYILGKIAAKHPDMVLNKRSPRKAPKTQKLIMGIISVCFIAWAVLFIYRSSFIAIDGRQYFCLFDDAMISMRYAWNFAHGFGLVWNPGEYIQGYTNLLMVLLMSFANFVFNKSTAVLFIQIIGVNLMLLNAYISTLIADHFVENEPSQKQVFIKTLVFFCALSYYPLTYWSLMGMETGLLTLFLLLGVLSSLDYTRYKKRTFLLSMSVYLGMAYLTRNDSLVFAFLVWLFVIWEILELNNFQRHASHLTGAAILYVLFVIGQGVFQFLYYGEWMPNTYTLKLVGMSLLARLKNGVRFIIPFLKGTALLLSVSYLDMFFDFQKKKVLLLSIITSAIAYQIYVGGDPWRYWRIMSPSVPLLFILFVYAIYVVVKSMSETAVFRSYFLRNPLISKRYVTGGLVFIFAVLGLVIANSRFLTEISLLQKPYTSSANQRNVNTAIAINELTTNNASVGVFWAGSIPYYTGKYAIDFLGKSDKHIAKLPPDSSVSWNGMDGVPGHNKYDLTYSIQLKKPTYVQGFKWGSQDLSSWSQDNYTEIKYKGVNLFLLKEDHSVLWSKVDK